MVQTRGIYGLKDLMLKNGIRLSIMLMDKNIILAL